MVIVLVSSYKEGPLLRSCIQSAQSVGGPVVVFDGPLGAESSDVLTVEQADGLLQYAEEADVVKTGCWLDDADKRTAMLHYAQAMHATADLDNDPLWVLWLDGDEILLWGEYLQDIINRAEAETGAGGFLIRQVELDGSVVACHGRIIRGDMITRYVHSTVTVELRNGLMIGLGNEKLCAAGGVPVWTDDTRAIQVDDLARLRPPLAGEPHVLHRSMLRDPLRGVERQSDAEARWYQQNDPTR